MVKLLEIWKTFGIVLILPNITSERFLNYVYQFHKRRVYWGDIMRIRRTNKSFRRLLEVWVLNILKESFIYIKIIKLISIVTIEKGSLPRHFALLSIHSCWEQSRNSRSETGFHAWVWNRRQNYFSVLSSKAIFFSVES